MGIFWPEKILIREEVAYEPGALTLYDGREGMCREKKFGEPSGSMEVYKFKKQSVQRGKECGQSQQQSDKQLKDTWLRIQANMGDLSLDVQKGDNGENAVHVTQKRQKRDDSGDSWDAGVLPKSTMGFKVEEQTTDKDLATRGAKRRRKGVRKEPTPRNAARPSSPMPKTSPRDSKRATSSNARDTNVFPSVQMRAISSLDHMCMDAETMLSSFANLNDVGGVAPTRLRALARKLEGKTSSDASVDVFTAANTISVDGKTEPGNLCIRGKTCLENARRISFHHRNRNFVFEAM